MHSAALIFHDLFKVFSRLCPLTIFFYLFSSSFLLTLLCFESAPEHQAQISGQAKVTLLKKGAHCVFLIISISNRFPVSYAYRK